MRILFTGGGSGGHFYPIISIVEELSSILKDKRLLDAELYFMSPNPYDSSALFEHNITFIKNRAGKSRLNSGLMSIVKNFFDLFQMGWGVVTALITLYKLYPDVVFGKGGFASFPAILAARILRIPVVIHESDTVPGRVNLWAGRFAERVALSYKEAGEYFKTDKVAYTGHPVRKDIMSPITEGSHEFLKLEPGVPVILILGGSQGAERINDAILGGLPNLVERYQIIHQVGVRHFKECQSTAEAVLVNSAHKGRYRPFDYLNPLAQRMAAGIADVVVSRAGSTIFEIAAWKKPAIIIPIAHSNGDHQRKNAFAYARSGACTVVEETNLTHNILLSEIERILTSEEVRNKMKEGAASFGKPEAAHLVAEEIAKIALSHEIVT